MKTYLAIATALQEAPADAAPAESPGPNMIFMLSIVFLIFYFLAWRPQAKERKRREEMLGSLKVGDKVMTTSGIFGVVANLKEHEVVLKVDEKNNVKMRFSRQTVQSILRDESAADQPPEKAKAASA